MAVGNAGRGGGRGGRGGRGKHTHSGRGKTVEEDGVAEHDVYEAEQLEPEEKRNKIVKRYDQVENYEYEMPSDFEDEEVSEDEAFDSDDESKFAHFFQKRDEAGSKAGKGKAKVPQEEEDDEDISQEESDSSDGDASEDSDDESEEELSEEAYQAMLKQVGQVGRSKHAIAAEVLTEAYPEGEYNLDGAAGTGGGDGGELSVEHLVGALGRAPGLGALKKKLARVDAGELPLATPLPPTVQGRLERKAAYEAGAKDISKWRAQVKANREAPTLDLTKAEDVTKPTTAGWNATFTPQTDMEKEVAAMLAAGGAGSARAVQERRQEGEELELKQLTVEEAEARRGKLRKLRVLMFKHEMRAKHIKKIKSRAFHKANKKKKGNAGDLDPEETREAALRQEWERAKERLTLKHRNTSRWAQRILKKGLQLNQEGTKAALAEQLRKGSELSRKMSTLEELSSDDDLGALSDSTEASDFDDEREANLEAGDGEEGEGNKKLNKADKGIAAARRRAEAVLAGIDDEAAEEPQGLFALPFMARALSKQRQQSQREASQLLEELDRAERQQARDSSDEQMSSDDEPAGPTRGARRFGGSSRAVTAVGGEEAEEQEQEDGRSVDEEAAAGKPKVQAKARQSKAKHAKAESVQDVPLNAAGQAVQVAEGAGHATRIVGPLTVDVGLVGASGKTARAQKAAVGSDWELEPVPAPYLGGALGNEKMTKAAREAAAAKPKAAGAAAATTIGVAGSEGRGLNNRKQATEDEEDNSEDEDDDNATVGGVTNKQRALIQAAFVGDDVEGEFAADKAKEVEGELPKVDAPVMLPGWGAWNGMQKEPKFIRDKRVAAERERRKAEEGRRDKGKKAVAISEKYDKKASAFHTQALPHGWSSHEVFDRALRVPLGRDFNTDASFRDMTRPRVLTTKGKVVAPLKLDEKMTSATPPGKRASVAAHGASGKRAKR